MNYVEMTIMMMMMMIVLPGWYLNFLVWCPKCSLQWVCPSVYVWVCVAVCVLLYFPPCSSHHHRMLSSVNTPPVLCCSPRSLKLKRLEWEQISAVCLWWCRTTCAARRSVSASRFMLFFLRLTYVTLSFSFASQPNCSQMTSWLCFHIG